MMHKEAEVYMDDMIIKSRVTENHVWVLRKVFKRLRKYQLKLNPAKCVFGAKSGKLLGFIVSEKGIEIDPNKIRAIREMPSPKMERDVRSFLGKLNYISRFISNLTAKAKPIFKLLRIILPNGTKIVKRLLKGLSTKWKVILSQYDIVYMIRKAVKGSVIADLLVENPINDYEALDFEFPNEYINTVSNDVECPNDVWEVYFDGAVNLTSNGIGAVLVALDGRHFPIAVKIRFGCTNNVAEYEACVSSLQAAIEMKIKKLEARLLLDTLEKDCIEYFRKCQVYANQINVPPCQLYNLASPWPFAMWGINVIGPINPKASNGHRFILVAIDYFTKWVQATLYAHITQNTFLKFFKNNIICRYGLSREFITDNAKNLNGLKVQKLCDQ
ncbi:uncharacterized protein LOC131182880 [Hevea brasiliensis]|uniref:uncharacterized protein LOC131182880 n=1 Tax=Hevea brasiliensis TaxID=3981 RepID=UPI0025ECDE5E|nr:uncharacterized protein LOC131182880 [Hevea brasiliensis]